MRPDGTWPDVDYASRDAADFPALEHLRRAQALPPAERLTALEAWRRLAPRSDNWWYNEIGAPQVVGDALLDLDLSPTDRASWGEWLAAAIGPVPKAGQNLVWVSAIHLRRGLITRDDAVVTEAVERMCSVLAFTDEEGVQRDHSFHQHGPQLYSGGYGASLVASLTRWLHLFPEPAVRFFTDFLLDGQQWFAHGSSYDFAAMGRELVRPDAHRLDSLREAVDRLSGSPYRAEEVAALAARLDGDGPPLVGTKWFPRSDYLAHRRPTWAFAVRMSSTRTVPTETLNGENTLGRHLGDGVATFRVGAADGYREVLSRWDWARLPGTTTEQGRSLLPRPYLERGAAEDVLGWADGEHGVAVMRLAGVDRFTDGWKAWFCFPDAVVALGAGISAPGANRVITTVDQRLAVDEPTTGGPTAGAVRHGGLTYLPLSPHFASVENGIFTLGFDHGPGPVHASYACVVAPDLPEVEVLANTPAVQSVRCGGTTLTRRGRDVERAPRR
ncbi:polysaccharide lyase family 8 super-sandwich domain-containing protein [Actinosynnema sp. NPDC023658]|uniref:polysaccharide lyase family 8 super-sandwich domain-containing protein n=1 Tax=Actinosynnema sp. NPDC023658 TaxID=3155465 RepID=UPI0033C62E67